MRKFAVVLLFVGALGMLVPLGAQDDGFQKLTDQRGRSMEAKVLAVSGDSCRLQRRDGKVFTLKIAMFALSDQKVIRSLAADAEGAADPVVGFDEGAEEPGEGAADVINEPVFAFEDVAFKGKKTKHFDMQSTTRSFRPAEKNVETVWNKMVSAVPGIRDDFERLQFAAPGQSRNRADFKASANRFLYRVYLVHSAAEYEKVVKAYGATLEGQTQAFFLRMVPQVGSFDDFDNRWMLLFLEPGRDEDSYASLLAHMLSGQLVRGYQQKQDMPLWLAAGLGYWTEHQMFKRCVVSYMDYEAYYAEEGNVVQSDIFEMNKAWTSPLKAACKKGERYSLTDVVGVEVAGMTPRMAGYVFALHMFLLSDADKRRRYGFLQKAIREGTAATDVESVLRAYGFADEATFNTAWYTYILSGDFR